MSGADPDNEDDAKISGLSNYCFYDITTLVAKAMIIFSCFHVRIRFWIRLAVASAPPY